MDWETSFAIYIYPFPLCGCDCWTSVTLYVFYIFPHIRALVFKLELFFICHLMACYRSLRGLFFFSHCLRQNDDCDCWISVVCHWLIVVSLAIIILQRRSKIRNKIIYPLLLERMLLTLILLKWCSTLFHINSVNQSNIILKSFGLENHGDKLLPIYPQRETHTKQQQINK